MYAGPWLDLPDARFLDWSIDSECTSIAGLAREIIAMAEIGKRDALIGSSLGGMVACEIAKQVAVDRLFLIGSAVSPNEISGFLRMLHPLVDLTPLAFVQGLSGKLPSEIGNMFSEADPTFVRGMCRAVFTWDGYEASATPLHRIHGRHDRVIPPPASGATLLDGGHLIAMSHAKACVEWVSDILESVNRK